MPATWIEQYDKMFPDNGLSREEKLAKRADRAVAIKITEQNTRDNAKRLQASGIQPTGGNLYLAHHFGVGGARGLIKASADTPASEILDAASVKANPHVQGKTARQIIEWALNKVR